MAGATAVLVLLGTACATRNAGIWSYGEQQFRSRCQSCHSLPKPGSRTATEWPPLVARYGERAKLTQTQVDSIIVFLQAQSRSS